MAAITMRGLSTVYPGGVRAVDSLDLDIADGEFFALLGPSGCGKTTLLRTVAGLELPAEGTLHLGDRDVTKLPPGARDVAMVFQDYALFPHMTVVDNIAYPLRIKKVPREKRRATARDTGDGLSLTGLMDRRPGELSGGQQQRVALARAMVAHPRVFLFDEPLSNLDARLRLEARTFLKKLQHDLGVTTVFVTHDQAEALALADRIAVMRDGRIRQVGTPREVFRRPATTFVANFIGSTPMNLLDAEVTGDTITLPAGTLPLPAGTDVATGDTVTVGLRPEYLTLHRAEPDTAPTGVLTGQVAIVENLGTTSLVTLDTDSGPVGAVVGEDDEPPLGTKAWLIPTPGRLLLYRTGGDGTLIATADPPV